MKQWRHIILLFSVSLISVFFIYKVVFSEKFLGNCKRGFLCNGKGNHITIRTIEIMNYSCLSDNSSTILTYNYLTWFWPEWTVNTVKAQIRTNTVFLCLPLWFLKWVGVEAAMFFPKTSGCTYERRILHDDHNKELHLTCDNSGVKCSMATILF